MLNNVIPGLTRDLIKPGIAGRTRNDGKGWGLRVKPAMTERKRYDGKRSLSLRRSDDKQGGHIHTSANILEKAALNS